MATGARGLASLPTSVSRTTRGRRLAAAAVCLLALPATAPTVAHGRIPDRDASTVLVQGMPVEVARATFFDDGSVIALGIRNAGYEVARARVRIAVFDDRLRLKGSVAYCTGIVQPSTRQPVLIPLEVKGASARDRFVIAVEEVLTPRRAFTLRESLPAVLREMRNALDQRGVSLTTVETTRSGEPPPCPCECEAAAAQAEQGCGEPGPTAFTCTPMPPGCSQGFTCKP